MRTIAGTLELPDGTPISSGVIRFTSITSTPNTPKQVYSDITITNGSYSDDINIGTYNITLYVNGLQIGLGSNISVVAGSSIDVLSLIGATDMNKYSTVITTPAANLTASNQLAELVGYGPNNFSVPLGDVEAGPVTHYGLHTYARQAFVDMLIAAQSGTMPVVSGMTSAEVAAIFNQWTVLIEPGDTRLPLEHFNSAIGNLIKL